MDAAGRSDDCPPIKVLEELLKQFFMQSCLL